MELRKNTRTIGTKGEFLSENGSILAFCKSEDFTEEFIRSLRKKAMYSRKPTEILLSIVEYVESLGILKRGRGKEEEHMLVVRVASLFCVVFGVSIIEAKSISILDPSIDQSLVKYEQFITDELLPMIDLYRDDWEKLAN